MSKTVVKFGRLYLIYVDNAQGRRLLIADAEPPNTGNPMRDALVKAIEHPLTLAATQEEAREAVRALRDLLQELPGHEPVRVGGSSE